jgi:CxxC motif-containing protein (DUF1111 family)
MNIRLAVGVEATIVAIAAIMCVETANAQAPRGHNGSGSHFRNRNPQPSQTPLFAGIGAPLPGVASVSADLTNFNNGLLNFEEVETLNSADATSGPAGQLGPLFNSTSCTGCHNSPAIGGGGLTIVEQRLSTGGPPVKIFAVDHMLFGWPQAQANAGVAFPFGVTAPPLGGEIGIPDNVPSPCQQVEMARGFTPNLPIYIADGPNDTGLAGTPTCIAHRQSLPLFGDGLVEATDDSTFSAIAAAQPVAIRGVVRIVTDLDNFDGLAAEVSDETRTALGVAHVARFGWKDDFSTLIGFAADAYFNEVGITNDLNSVPNTTCAMGVTQYGVVLQTADDPEDTVDTTGRADIDRFTDFMRSLQQPPQLPLNSSAMQGQALFNQAGCGGCHLQSITTSQNPAAFLAPTVSGIAVTSNLASALTNVTYHPFGDFLLHDMGSLGDGVNDDSSLTHDES